MLLEALVACAGVALKAVATSPLDVRISGDDERPSAARSLQVVEAAGYMGTPLRGALCASL
jgi:hypothetical protein